MKRWCATSQQQGMSDGKTKRSSQDDEGRTYIHALSLYLGVYTAEGTICNRLRAVEIPCWVERDTPELQPHPCVHSVERRITGRSQVRTREPMCDLLFCCQFPLKVYGARSSASYLTSYGKDVLGQAIIDHCSCHALQHGVLSTSAPDWYLETGNI